MCRRFSSPPLPQSLPDPMHGKPFFNSFQPSSSSSLISNQMQQWTITVLLTSLIYLSSFCLLICLLIIPSFCSSYATHLSDVFVERCPPFCSIYVVPINLHNLQTAGVVRMTKGPPGCATATLVSRWTCQEHVFLGPNCPEGPGYDVGMTFNGKVKVPVKLPFLLSFALSHRDQYGCHLPDSPNPKRVEGLPSGQWAGQSAKKGSDLPGSVQAKVPPSSPSFISPLLTMLLHHHITGQS